MATYPGTTVAGTTGVTAYSCREPLTRVASSWEVLDKVTPAGLFDEINAGDVSMLHLGAL